MRVRMRALSYSKCLYKAIQVGEELLVFDKSRGYIFYTMRGGLNNR
jgi:hypothetical protein